MADGEALFKELLDTFRLEAQDHLGAMASLLVTLENESDATQHRGLVESLFRRMHTLKGAAHAVNLDSVAKLCQELEDLLAGVKRGELPLDGLLFDRLHDELDALSALAVEQVVTGAGSSPDALRPLPPAPFPPVGTDPPSPAPLQGEAEAVEKPVAAGADPERRPAQQEKGAGDTVRVSTRLLEALLLQAEELVSAKLTASSLSAEVTALSAELTGRAPAVLRALDLAREALRKGQQDPENGKLANLLQERCSDQLAAENRLRALEKSALKQVRSLQSLVDPLLDDVKKLHLLPFSSLTDPFAKLVRDLGRELGKEAELSCSGCEIEVDRRILAELKEPLLHLVRNVMDHGIEKAEQRKAFGKPARGRISIEVRLQDANLAEVLVSDDGRGIEVTQVKGAALRMELLPAEVLAAMSNAEALQLIFESGISTSPIITNLSGRGVGLAIVRESVEKLGGHVTVTSQPGQATVFSLLLPLSFAMLRALLVESAGRPCFLPAANVELAGRFSRDEIRSVENRDTVLIGGAITPVVSLARLLELAEPAPELPPGLQAMVLLNGAGKRIAFAVDQVVEVQEILVKPLGNQLSRVRNVAGATVLGTDG